MAAFLPQLVCLIGFVPQLEVMELLKERRVFSVAQFVEDAPGGVGLEAADLCAQIRPARDPVQMVLHDDVTENLDTALVLQEAPRIQDDVNECQL